MEHILGADVETLKKIIIQKYGNDKIMQFTKWLPQDLQQIFLNTNKKTWVPVEIMARLYDSAGQYFFPNDNRQVYRLHKVIAKNTYSGIYKILVALSSIKFLIRRAANVWKLFYDNGEAFAEYESNQSLKFIVKDFPKLPHTLREATDAHIYVLVRSSGANEVIVTRDDTNHDCWVWNVTWSK